MRRRGRWGWPAPGGGAGLREVDGRYLRGTPQVERGHVPCWQVAARMAWHVMRYASCPRCRRAASLFAGVGPASGQWRDRTDRSCRTGPGLARESLAGVSTMAVQIGFPRWDTIRRMYGRGEWRASAAAGRWLSGVPGRVQDSSGAVRCSWTQLDFMGHDPKPASR
jgi:hypothetical protein